MCSAIAAPETAGLSYEKSYTLDSEYKLVVRRLSPSLFASPTSHAPWGVPACQESHEAL